MTNFGWAWGVGVLAPSFLMLTALGCSGSDASAVGKPASGGSSGSSHGGNTGGVYTSGTGGSNGATGVGGQATTGTAGGSMGCTAPMVVTAQPTADLLTNLDTDSAVSGFSPGGGWFSYKDTEPTGVLTPENTAFMTESPGANGSASAVHVVGSGFMPDQAGQNFGGGVGFSLASPQGTPGDLSGAVGFTFYAKSGKASALSDIKVAVSTTGTDPIFCLCNAVGCYNSHFVVEPTVAAEWGKFTVRWSDLKQAPEWGYQIPFDPKTVLTINFVSNGALPAFDFWVDEVSLIH